MDLNRNWPELWLQPYPDAGEFWGTAGSFSDMGSQAGTAAGSEPEIQAMISILRDALLRVEESRHPMARLPAVALDVHSALGQIFVGSHVSSAIVPRSDANDEAWLCGALSDCVHADMPALAAIFGTNNRSSVLGTTGLANPVPPGDDPPVTYGVGRNTFNIYPTSGELSATMMARRWFTGANPTRRGIPAATVEVTAYAGGNPFGFGTCAPPLYATEAIEQVVRDMLPLVARMAEASLDPADPPSASVPKNYGLNFPTPRDIHNLGIVAEAEAEAKTWKAGACTTTDDLHCFNRTCNPSVGDQCSGIWWSAYRGSDEKPRHPLRSFWAIATKHPDPDSLVPEEAQASAVRLVLVSCAPGDRCARVPRSLTLIRRGSLFDLWGLELPFDVAPERIVVRREVRHAATWKARGEQLLVAGEIPAASWPEFPDASRAPERLRLADLAPHHQFYDIRVDVPARNDRRSKVELALSFPGAGNFPLLPGQVDVGSLFDAALPAEYPAYASPFAYDHAWYTYDFDLHGIAANGLAQSGASLYLARRDNSDAVLLRPHVTALARRDDGPGPRPCALTALGFGAELDAARFVRDTILAHGTWGTRFVEAYERFSPEVSRLGAAHPELRAAIQELLAAGLRAVLAAPSGALDEREVDAKARAVLPLLERWASSELRAAARLAVHQFPRLALELRIRFAAAFPLALDRREGGSP